MGGVFLYINMASIVFNFYTTPSKFVEIVTDGVSTKTYAGNELKPLLAGDVPAFMLADNRRNAGNVQSFSITQIAAAPLPTGDTITAVNVDDVAQVLPVTITDFYATYKSYFFSSASGGGGGTGGVVTSLSYDAATGLFTLEQDAGTTPLTTVIPTNISANESSTAFLSENGDNGTAVVGNRALPYRTIDAAYAQVQAAAASVIGLLSNYDRDTDGVATPLFLDTSVTFDIGVFALSSTGFPLFWLTTPLRQQPWILQ